MSTVDGQPWYRRSIHSIDFAIATALALFKTLLCYAKGVVKVEERDCLHALFWSAVSLHGNWIQVPSCRRSFVELTKLPNKAKRIYSSQLLSLGSCTGVNGFECGP